MLYVSCELKDDNCGSMVIRYVIIAFLLFIVGCSSEMDSQVDLLTAFDFESGDQEWDGGISDFPVGYEDSIYFQMNTEKVANSFALDGGSTGLNISGENPHGDLFYYFKRKISGLQPKKNYKLDFEFLVYAQLLKQPDQLSLEELYLKIGAVNYQPELQEVLWRNSLDYKALNLDKGDVNSEGGQDMINVGSIKDFTSEVPEIISGNTFDMNFDIESNEDGDIWILIGVDSGIRSYLTFGLEALTVYYNEK